MMDNYSNFEADANLHTEEAEQTPYKKPIRRN